MSTTLPVYADNPPGSDPTNAESHRLRVPMDGSSGLPRQSAVGQEGGGNKEGPEDQFVSKTAETAVFGTNISRMAPHAWG